MGPLPPGLLTLNSLIYLGIEGREGATSAIHEACSNCAGMVIAAYGKEGLPMTQRIPDGSRARRALDFYKTAFGAKEVMRIEFLP